MSIDITDIQNDIQQRDNPNSELSEETKLQLILLKKILNQLRLIEQHTRPINPQ